MLGHVVAPRSCSDGESAGVAAPWDFSNRLSPQETDRPFPEPAIFAVNPSGQAQIIDISNAPFSRPDLDNLLTGMKFVREKDYPIRGTLS